MDDVNYHYRVCSDERFAEKKDTSLCVTLPQEKHTNMNVCHSN